MKKTLKLASLALALVMVTSVLLSGTFAKYVSEVAGQDTALVARWQFGAEGGFIEGNTPTPKSLDLFSHAYTKYITATGTDSDLESSSIIAPGVSGDFAVEFNYTGDVDAAITLALSKTLNAPGKDVPLQFSLDSSFTTFTYNLDELAEQMLQNLYYANDTAKPGAFPGGWTHFNAATAELITANAGETNQVFNGATAGFNPAKVAFDLGVSAPQNTVVITKTDAAENITFVKIPVYWRWPYDVEQHNTTQLADAGFTGSGTLGKWLDADDTALGVASQGADRLEYKLNVNVIATQVVPES